MEFGEVGNLNARECIWYHVQTVCANIAKVTFEPNFLRGGVFSMHSESCIDSRDFRLCTGFRFGFFEKHEIHYSAFSRAPAMTVFTLLVQSSANICPGRSSSSWIRSKNAQIFAAFVGAK